MQIHKTRSCVGLALLWASVSPFALGDGGVKRPGMGPEKLYFDRAQVNYWWLQTTLTAALAFYSK